MTKYKFTPAPYKLAYGKWKAKIVIEEDFGKGVNIIELPKHDKEYDSEEEAFNVSEKLVLTIKNELGLIKD